ncbi:MAG: PIN domain-containing protein [Candidatus Aenigmatarchaeota archaeon]
MSLIFSIVMDANFLMIPEEFNVDVFEEIERLIDGEYELLVPETVVNELISISKKKGTEAKAARVALELMENKNVQMVETEGGGDEGVIEAAGKQDKPVVATNDKRLKKECKERSFPVIYMRTRDHLEIG